MSSPNRKSASLVMVVDTHMSGHHVPFLKVITDQIARVGQAVVIVLPAKLQEPWQGTDVRTVPFAREEQSVLSRQVSRIIWFIRVFALAVRIRPSVIHFLTADYIIQHYGLGFGLLSLAAARARIVLTLHHFPNSHWRRLALVLTARRVGRIVVHTEHVLSRALESNVPAAKLRMIHYPVTHPYVQPNSTAREKFGIDRDTPVILAAGSTRYDKGLDLLASALSTIREDFVLLVVGSEEDITERQVAQLLGKNRNNLVAKLARLSDVEFSIAVDAADIVALPYRRTFDGASGPLNEAAWRRKPVLASNHGSLGQLVLEYQLGLRFQSEDRYSLRAKLLAWLREPKKFVWSEQAETYRESIDPARVAKRLIEVYES